MAVLSPFVYWAQNARHIFIKVELKDVKDPFIEVNQRQLQFKSKGMGAQGVNDYEFTLDFKGDLDVDKCEYRIKETKVHFILTKTEEGWWPRLISQPRKPVWLKIDFDRWQSEEDLNDDESVRDIREDYPDLYGKLQKEEIGYRRENYKKVYLTFYNLFMYTGFMYVMWVLLVRYVRDGSGSFPGTYKAIGHIMCFLQLIQYLEVMHPMFGYVKGSIMMPFMQISGRCFILFAMLEFEPKMQNMPVVFYLFLVWSTIEIIRYPYYMMQLYKKQNDILTWVRYTAWIILYPIGFTCEAVIVFRNIIFADQSDKWSVAMPNLLNFTFHLPTFLRMYILFIMFPAIYVLMSHMNRMRKQKLGKKRANITKCN